MLNVAIIEDEKEAMDKLTELLIRYENESGQQFGISCYLASLRIRGWDAPNKYFSGLGGEVSKAKNRKRVLACCACYRDPSHYFPRY